MEKAFVEFIGISNDLRICKINEKIYIYTSELLIFIECVYDIHTNTIIFLRITNFLPQGKEFAGHNFAPFNIIKIDSISNLLYLDWFMAIMY